MSALYGDSHREFQDEFDNRKLADRLTEMIVQEEIGDEEQKDRKPTYVFSIY